MDAARVTQTLLELGLTIHSAMRKGRYVVKVTGGKNRYRCRCHVPRGVAACFVAVDAGLALQRVQAGHGRPSANILPIGLFRQYVSIAI